MKNASVPELAPATAPSAEDYGAYGADYRFSRVEETADAELRRLLACWNEIRGARAMPTRSALNPFILRSSLRFVQLFEIVNDGKDFRFKVMGSGIVEQTGLHLTGKCISELESVGVRTRVTAALRRVLETRGPVRLTADHSALGHLAHKQTEAIWLPLGDEARVTHILSGVIFSNRNPA